MCLVQLVFLYCIAFEGGGCLTHICAACFIQTRQETDLSSQLLSIFNPTFLKIVPLFILCPKKNLFNLLVYLGAVFLCPSVLSLLSHGLCASPLCVPVTHKSNPLQTPRHSGVYTSGWGAISPGKGGNSEFAHECWETRNRPSAA